jgi:hypothetical protein
MPNVLVWGDSHAMALMPGLKELAKTHHLHLYFVGKYWCAPLLAPADPTTVGTSAGTFSYQCAMFNAAVIEAIKRLDPQFIILDAYWVPAGTPPGGRDIAAGIEHTLGQAAHRARQVCVVFGVPILKYQVSHALLMAQRRSIPDDFLKLSRTEALAPYRDMESDLRTLEARGALRVADPKDALCPDDSCLYKVNGHSLYFDESHLSAYGAVYVAHALEPCFDFP